MLQKGKHSFIRWYKSNLFVSPPHKCLEIIVQDQHYVRPLTHNVNAHALRSHQFYVMYLLCCKWCVCSTLCELIYLIVYFCNVWFIFYRVCGVFALLWSIYSMLVDMYLLYYLFIWSTASDVFDLFALLSVIYFLYYMVFIANLSSNW